MWRAIKDLELAPTRNLPRTKLLTPDPPPPPAWGKGRFAKVCVFVYAWRLSMQHKDESSGVEAGVARRSSNQ